jgi:hypothetical protein
MNYYFILVKHSTEFLPLAAAVCFGTQGIFPGSSAVPPCPRVLARARCREDGRHRTGACLYQPPLIPTVRNRHALTRVLARPAPARAIGWGESPSAAAGITLRRLPIDRIETPRGATSAPIDGYGLDICRLLRLARDHRAAGDSWLESGNTRKPAGDGTARPLPHCAR